MADRRASRIASSIEEMPTRVPEGHYDVAILGGGLAGLSMAIQLKRERPDTSIVVIEKRADPPREAAFKVGESSVENGAHYYREIVGMRDHLEERQLRKHGLRFVLPADTDEGHNTDVTKRVEFCTPAHLAAYTHQIARGRFENELYDRCLKLGVAACRGFRVQEVDLAGDKHTVKMSHEFGAAEVTAHWVVDAAGRANIIRNKLDLGTDTGHHINASWFRLYGGMDFEQWTDDEEWLNRMPELGMRQYSTTHLIDAGYWLWLIQLAPNTISIGICADPRFHPFERINSFDAFLDWMKEHEPQLAAFVEPRKDKVLDFLRVEDFSYASSQFFSKDRWTMVGEAGGFIDAFYSPGSDFIAYSNTWSCELIKAELDGNDITELTDFYNEFFLRVFNTTILLYRDNYQFWGNPQIMVAKVVFDSLNYFTTLGSPFVHGYMTKREDIERLAEVFEAIIPLIATTQQFFRDWHAVDQTQWQGVSVLSKELEPYIHAQEEIGLPADRDQLVEQAKAKLPLIRALVVWIFHKGVGNLPEAPDADTKINPLAISMDPSRWEADGLFNGEGMSLNEARELLPQIDEMDLAARGAVAAG